MKRHELEFPLKHPKYVVENVDFKERATFSTFSNDGLMLIKQGFYGLFALYTLLSILLGFFAVLGGSILGKTF